MDLGIAGRRAAVAGASSGLGFATAEALAREGVSVAICGRNAETIEAAAKKIGANATPLVVDVSTPEGSMRFVEEARSALGGIDILVTNSGGPPPGNFESTPVEAYPDALALNLLSVVAMCKAAVPEMQSQHWGRVLAITSIAVRQPIGALILSNTARAGATGFLKTLSNEVAKDGITVNSIQPGYHSTDRFDRVAAGMVDEMVAAVPAKVIGSPADFGATAAFLCSEHAKYINGAAIPVDGGLYSGLL